MLTAMRLDKNKNSSKLTYWSIIWDCIAEAGAKVLCAGGDISRVRVLAGREAGVTRRKSSVLSYYGPRNIYTGLKLIIYASFTRRQVHTR